MRLTHEQRTQVEAWLQRHRARTCPICGLSGFSVAQVTVAPAMVQVICENCAYVLLFDAEAIGVVPQP
jgi:transcription elongation factor Elf1